MQIGNRPAAVSGDESRIKPLWTDPGEGAASPALTLFLFVAYNQVVLQGANRFNWQQSVPEVSAGQVGRSASQKTCLRPYWTAPSAQGGGRAYSRMKTGHPRIEVYFDPGIFFA